MLISSLFVTAISIIIIGNDAVLTIEPGVIVRLEVGKIMSVGSAAFGKGTLVARGRQIVETRKYVAAFNARERALTFIALNPDRPSELGTSAIGLLKHADYVAGAPEALVAVADLTSGAQLTLNGENTEEIISRLGRETRAGLWAVVCTIGSPSESHQELLQSAEKHCDKVVIQGAGG